MVDLASLVLTACAAVLAVFVVRRIERHASATATRRAESVAETEGEAVGAVIDEDPSDRRTGWRMRPSWVGFVSITGAFLLSGVLFVIAQAGNRETTPSALPHDAPSLEAGLPDAVAGEHLVHWSIRGEHYFTSAGVDAAGIAQVKADLAKDGLVMDDVAFAVDGRASLSDAPYFVNAFRIQGVPAASLPETVAIDHPDAGTFTDVVLAGKQVRRGTTAMLDQTDHQRGMTYLYDAGEVRYIIVTDSDSWAADALRQLP